MYNISGSAGDEVCAGEGGDSNVFPPLLFIIPTCWYPLIADHPLAITAPSSLLDILIWRRQR